MEQDAEPGPPLPPRARSAHGKWWPGPLRVLGGLQLLFGSAVLACVGAAVQHDAAAWAPGALPASERGPGAPRAPFVLAVAAVAWLLSAVLLALGATSFHRRVLLRAAWWPPTEAALNALLFLLYVAAAGAYVDTVTLEALCSSAPVGGPLLSTPCHPAGGQAAAIIFLFLTTLLYLAASAVCIRTWRREATRRCRGTHLVPPAPPGSRARHVTFEDEIDPKAAACGEKSGALVCSTALTRAVPDYVLKYPTIRSAWQRERYKAVFCDQHAEYRELRGQVRAALHAVLSRPEPPAEQHRVAHVWCEYSRVKRDSALLEKQERCDYLRKKLLHIKSQIREYDRAAAEDSVCF